jgi:hypothetical protein
MYSNGQPIAVHWVFFDMGFVPFTWNVASADTEPTDAVLLRILISLFLCGFRCVSGQFPCESLEHTSTEECLDPLSGYKTCEKAACGTSNMMTYKKLSTNLYTNRTFQRERRHNKSKERWNSGLHCVLMLRFILSIG